MRNTTTTVSSVALMLIAMSASLAIPDALAQEAASTKATGLLGQVDIYAKVFGAVLTALGTLFGLPLTILHFRKTKAEIKNLELQSQSLENSGTEKKTEAGVYEITIHGNSNAVQILADPRFLAPLLLLLDFIIAWIIITLASHLLGLFVYGTLRVILLLVLAAFLLIPIFREARRVRAVLRPGDESGDADAT